MPTLRTKVLFVGALVGIAHIISGIAVLMEPAALNVTALAFLHHLTAYSRGGELAAACLLAAGFMAVVAGCVRFPIPRLDHALLFLPQQALLLLQIWTISVALVTGKYPDGYIPQGGAWFILTDQIWAWVLAVSHSIWLAAFLYGSRGRGISGSS